MKAASGGLTAVSNILAISFAGHMSVSTLLFKPAPEEILPVIGALDLSFLSCLELLSTGWEVKQLNDKPGIRILWLLDFSALLYSWAI